MGKKYILLVLIAIVSVCFLDFFNFDYDVHQLVCSTKINRLPAACDRYYDFPIWDFLTSVGTIGATSVATYGLYQTSKIERRKDLPYVYSMKGNIQTDSGVANIEIVNYGKNIAKDIYVYIISDEEKIIVEENLTIANNKEPITVSNNHLDREESRNKVMQLKRKKPKLEIYFSDIHGKKFKTICKLSPSERNKVEGVKRFSVNRSGWEFVEL